MTVSSFFRGSALCLLLAGSLSAPAQAQQVLPNAFRGFPQQNQGRSPAEIRQDLDKARDELGVALNKYYSSPAYQALQQVMDFARAYEWRTTYQFQKVKRSPLPGEVLSLQADPAMSMEDAENYVKTVMGFALPPLSCGSAVDMKLVGAGIAAKVGAMVPVAGFPGSAGLTETMIKAGIQKAYNNNADAARPMIDAVRTMQANACTAIYTIAQIDFRAKRIKGVEANWNDCRDNGAEIWGWEHDKRHEFANRHRTTALRAGLTYKCGSIANGNLDDALEYNSYFKWSDDKERPLNMVKTIRAMQSSSGDPKTVGNCPPDVPKFCIPITNGALDLGLCAAIDGGVTSVTDSVKLIMAVKVHYRGETDMICAGPATVPAPFGLLNSLGEKMDSAKQDAKAKAMKSLSDALPGVSDAMAKVSRVTSLAGRLQ